MNYAELAVAVSKTWYDMSSRQWKSLSVVNGFSCRRLTPEFQSVSVSRGRLIYSGLYSQVTRKWFTKFGENRKQRSQASTAETIYDWQGFPLTRRHVVSSFTDGDGYCTIGFWRLLRNADANLLRYSVILNAFYCPTSIMSIVYLVRYWLKKRSK